MSSNTKVQEDYGLNEICFGTKQRDEDLLSPEQPREGARMASDAIARSSGMQEFNPDHAYMEIDLDNLNGILQNQAKRVARKPCTYLWISVFLSLALSAIGIIVGEFSVSANTGGWSSRGTLIADRQTQLMVVQEHQLDLFTGDSQYWQEIIDNVQPGWEDDDENTGRRLTTSLEELTAELAAATAVVDYLRPKSDRIEIARQLNNYKINEKKLPFEMTPDLSRKLQDAVSSQGCDASFYNPTNLTYYTRLSPMWKTTNQETTILDPVVIQDICEAETATQAHLEEKALCIPCETGCYPPYSIVLYARLVIGGMEMTCKELADAWAPLQESTEATWVDCVSEVKANFDPLDANLPDRCPEFFYTTLVGENFDVNGGSTRYTSSIFATPWTEALFDESNNYDRGSNSVEGAYDTQYEDFVNIYLDEVLSQDMALALGSALIVAIAVLIHTRSPFLTGIGLLQIILSFPLAYFVYKLVAGLNFFPFLNFIGIFVVFALGAGDIFVAVDKWKNARIDFPVATTEQIAALALPDALLAMFLTTLTTAVAFFATAICPVAPIKMFAIFCGLLIIFDYVMNVMLVFPALCIYDRAIQTKGVRGVSCCMTCTCFGYLGGKNDEEIVLDAFMTSSKRRVCLQETIDGFEKDAAGKSLIRRVLFSFYYALHSLRRPLFVICWAALGISIYYATTLEQPTSSDVRLLKESTEYEKNYIWRKNLLSEALEKQSGSRGFVIWGVTPADTGDQNDPGTWTQLVLDTSFKPSSNDAQTFMIDFCEDMFQEEFAIKPENGYICPLSKFETWLREQSLSTEPEEIYDTHCNGATSFPVEEDAFDECIIAWAQAKEEYSILSRNGAVTVILFPFTSRVRYDDNSDTLDREWHLIESWVQDYNKKAPETALNGYFSSEDFWWYDTNSQMLKTAYGAAGIALGCAAAVILFSSRSLILTLFCTLTIGYVLTSVTSMLVAIGWTLGFLESICFAILIGVSVDFVIHLSHAYANVEGNVDRARRTKYALIKMGPSILATALTTILSAVIMLFTIITFFQKFALILFFTVIQATLGSFIWFVTMVDCIGPANPTYLLDKVTESCSKPTETEQTSRDGSDGVGGEHGDEV